MKTTWMRLHPLTQWMYYVIALVLGMLLFHPVQLCMGMLTLMVVHFCAFQQFRLGNWCKVAAMMTILFTILNPLFSHQGSHIIYIFYSHPITLEAVFYGITWGLSLSLIFLVFRLYQDCFPSSMFLAIFHRVSPQWTLLLMLTTRFVPMFHHRLREIWMHQKFRYTDTPSATWREKGKRIEKHILTLLNWSLEDSLQIVDSMKSRAYGKSERSSYEYFRFTYRDGFICGFMITLLLFEIYLWYRGYGVLQIYPTLASINFTNGELLSTSIECTILATPVLYEGGEQLRWYIWKWQMRLLRTQRQKRPL